MESRAGAMSIQKAHKAEGKSPKAEFIYYLLNDESGAITSTNSAGNGAFNRSQSFNSANLINAVNFHNGNYIPALKKYIIHPYPCCQAIGMKLLFPKHYFW